MVSLTCQSSETNHMDHICHSCSGRGVCTANFSEGTSTPKGAVAAAAECLACFTMLHVHSPLRVTRIGRCELKKVWLGQQVHICRAQRDRHAGCEHP